MNVFEKIILGDTYPAYKDVLWIDSRETTKVFRVFENGAWRPIGDESSDIEQIYQKLAELSEEKADKDEVIQAISAAVNSIRQVSEGGNAGYVLTANGDGSYSWQAMRAGVEVVSEDGSVQVEETQTETGKKYNLRVNPAPDPSSTQRITLSAADLETGYRELDFTDTEAFIIETYDARKLPEGFYFNLTGTYEQDMIYSFQFPGAAQSFILKENGTEIINTASAYPQGIYSGEVLKATPEAGTWTLQKDTAFTSSDNSIIITPLTGKGYDLKVYNPVPRIYVRNFSEFNNAVGKLYQNGGEIAVIGNIMIGDAPNVTTNRQFSIKSTDGSTYYNSDIPASDVCVDFGSRLDKIKVIGSSDKASFVFCEATGSGSGWTVSRVWSFMADRLDINGIIFRAATVGVEENAYAACSRTSQPVLIFEKEATIEDCIIRFQPGQSSTPYDGTVKPFIMQAGKSEIWYYLNLRNNQSITEFYSSSDGPVYIQNELRIVLSGETNSSVSPLVFRAFVSNHLMAYQCEINDLMTVKVVEDCLYTTAREAYVYLSTDLNKAEIERAPSSLRTGAFHRYTNTKISAASDSDINNITD